MHKEATIYTPSSIFLKNKNMTESFDNIKNKYTPTRDAYTVVNKEYNKIQ